MDAPIDLVLARWVFFAAAMILFGWSLFPLYAAWGAEIAGAFIARKSAGALACITLVAAVAWLLTLSHQLDDTRSVFGTAGVVLTQTSFGPDWIARLVLSAGAVACAFFGLRYGTLTAAAGLLICEGWDGHAAAHGLFGEMTQAIHVLSAGAWIGGLFGLLGLVSSALREKRETTALAPVRNFSNVAMVAVLLILLTGALNVIQLEPGLNLTGPYARVLAIKVCLVALMILFAAFNRFRFLTRIGEARDARRALMVLLRTTAFEQALGLAVLMAVAVLGLLDPYMANM